MFSRIVLGHQYSFNTLYLFNTRSYLFGRVARKSLWGAVLGVWGRSPQPPEANGGLGAKPAAAGGCGSGGKTPSRRRHRGVGAEPPALEIFAFFFAKIT